MTVTLIEPAIPYLSKKAKAQCTKAWRTIFNFAKKGDVTADLGDIALWVVNTGSATIRLRLRFSKDDDQDPAWEPPPAVVLVVDGLVEQLNDSLNEVDGARSWEEIEAEFHEWIGQAVVESFESASIQKLYEAYNSKSSPFYILLSPHDESLAHCELSTVWSNRRTRFKLNVKKSGKKKAVRKKSPSKLKAEGRQKTKRKSSAKKNKRKVTRRKSR